MTTLPRPGRRRALLRAASVAAALTALLTTGCSAGTHTGGPASKTAAPAADTQSAVGRTVTLDGFTFSVRKVVYPYQPADGTAAQKGSRFYAVQIAVTNRNKDSSVQRPGVFGVDGSEQDADLVGVPAPGSPSGIAVLHPKPGQTLTGWDVYQVPDTGRNLALLLRSQQHAGTTAQLSLFGAPASAAPVAGRAGTAAVGKQLHAGAWTIQVLDVRDPYPGQVSGPTPPGSHVLAVKATVTYTPDGSPPLIPLDLYANGGIPTRVEFTDAGSQPSCSDPYRQAGETRTCWAGYAVPNAATGLRLKLSALVHGNTAVSDTLPLN